MVMKKKLIEFMNYCLIGIFLNSIVINIAISEILDLDETCTISILNRSVQTAPDGSWQLDDVPSTMGQIRARATCVRNGETIFGQTDFFTVQTNQTTQVGQFEVLEEDSTPTSLDFATGSNTVLTGEQTFFLLQVFANYADGRREDVTAVSSGINYTVSNPQIAQVNENGILQGLASGRVLITARKEGAVASLSVTIVTTGDTDGDGLPDDYEIANGLDATDPVDAFEDIDNDGLSASEEFLAGTDINNADTDGDSISDGEEMQVGVDGFITNPLLADSDGDGINDDLELSVGTDPTDINSVDFIASLSELQVQPENPVITFNTIQGRDTSAQLTVTGTTIDGGQIDLTPLHTGTNYNSSDLSICNFGGVAGQVFAGTPGNCIVTAENSGFSDESQITVQNFSPQALSQLDLAFSLNTIKVVGQTAYVGSSDSFIIVDVSDPNNPVEINRINLNSSVDAIEVNGRFAYLATFDPALLVVDLEATPPQIVANSGETLHATDLLLDGDELLVAAGELGGLMIMDVSNPSIPQLINRFPAEVNISQIDLSKDGNTLAVIDGREVKLIEKLGSGLYREQSRLRFDDPRDLVFKENFLFVSGDLQGLISVNVSEPSAPQISNILPPQNTGIVPKRIKVFDQLAFLVSGGLSNQLPIMSIDDSSNPILRDVIDFLNADFGAPIGIDVAVNDRWIYMATKTSLQIAQYRQFVDGNGLSPRVEIVDPTFADQGIEGGQVNVSVNAVDDIAVASVSFLVNDVAVFTDHSEPFEYDVPLPIASSTATISVFAKDYGNNNSESASVTINLQADSDQDGLSDEEELNNHQTSPFEADTDGDGLNDSAEIRLGLSPLDDDVDDDGLQDGEEVLVGADGFFTDPFDNDSDDDGMSDGYESRFELNPLDPSDADLDIDNDGLTNLEEFQQQTDPRTADSDGDGMPDDYELSFGFDPFNANDFFGDFDQDGVPNGVEFFEQTDPTNPDVLGPEVEVLLPDNGLNIPVDSILRVRFNEEIQSVRLDEIVFTVMTADGQTLVDGDLSLSEDGMILSFQPFSNFALDTQYEVSLSGARDLAGNIMPIPFHSTFNTQEIFNLSEFRLIPASSVIFMADLTWNSTFLLTEILGGGSQYY